jgi:predicted transcriptional regulator
MKTFYSDYVNHCLRFYARHKEPEFKSEADKLNWKACEEALEEFTPKNRETLLTIFENGDTIPDSVYTLSKNLGVKQDSIWKLLSDLERKTAKKRGLI